MNPKSLLDWWPVILAVAGGIWWAAQVDTKLADMQAYITQTAQHANNLDYSQHGGSP